LHLFGSEMRSNAAYRSCNREPYQSGGAGWRNKEFDLISLPPRPRIHVKHADIHDVPPLLQYAEGVMGVSLACEATVARVACANPDTLWSFWRNGRLVGGFAVLMLNAAGLAALLDGTMDLSNPPAQLLARAGERPAGLYVWAVLGSAVGAEGVAHVIRRLQRRPYEAADVFALPATDDGLRFMRGLGFRAVPGHPRALHRYVRLANRAQPK
jgi:hypothetical protein